ncbi:universal stress protein [Prosthecomicrobium pneumaticum]|uniref:Nucleotide-binding universal stress UspA family protein n=1 Tax=Prosthecomicrobium pneumaticum TaxID=81895 RepID=A0A7W9FQV4_9HYPH|nr:universal stress protein [Prosthecomicrobium pneumaticum]MBB5755202.1 nucleotide-binding universal stress UspA family protein [Prosthecomicrobium pneumaticum]
MIKVLMVRLDGTGGDDFRLAATESLAKLFNAHVIGLIIDVLPDPTIVDSVVNVNEWSLLLDQARTAGREFEDKIKNRLKGLASSSEVRRIDAYAHELARLTARECRTADALVGLRLSDEDDAIELHDVVEETLFEAGRHIFLVADQRSFDGGFQHAVIAWNGSREATRAVAEALPYLENAKAVTVLRIGGGTESILTATQDDRLVAYLRRHGINVALERVAKKGLGDVATVLVDEVVTRKGDLLVMGGYGHSRLREWLLGGATYQLLRKSPVSLVMAH